MAMHLLQAGMPFDLIELYGSGKRARRPVIAKSLRRGRSSDERERRLPRLEAPTRLCVATRRRTRPSGSCRRWNYAETTEAPNKTPPEGGGFLCGR